MCTASKCLQRLSCHADCICDHTNFIFTPFFPIDHRNRVNYVFIPFDCFTFSVSLWHLLCLHCYAILDWNEPLFMLLATPALQSLWRWKCTDWIDIQSHSLVTSQVKKISLQANHPCHSVVVRRKTLRIQSVSVPLLAAKSTFFGKGAKSNSHFV